MKKKNSLIIGGILIAVAALILIFTLPRTITVILNGREQQVNTRAWRVEAALFQAVLDLKLKDRVEPALNSPLWGVEEIVVNQARAVYFHEYPSNTVTMIYNASPDPQVLFDAAGISPLADDRVFFNGATLDFETELPNLAEYHFEIKHAVEISIVSDGELVQTITSSEDTLGEALAAEEISFHPADRLNLPADRALDQDLTLEVKPAQPLTVNFADKSVEIYSAADTVGEALIQGGIALQNMDYSIPSEDSLIPEDGEIRVVRVREETSLTQTDIPFTSEYVQSDQVELDTTEVVQTGEFGVEVTRTLVRYEDGQEVSRVDDVTWIAKQPQNEVVGRGTKPVVRTMETPDGTIEYWRAVYVHATSYSPCRSGVDKCYYGTSMGLPVQRGVIGVTHAWYVLMAGQQVYVPGYGKGIIADVGGGIPGEYWIDLGFTDDDFEPWSSYVVMYFLTPVPDYIPWILP